jgi:hypothetical protein
MTKKLVMHAQIVNRKVHKYHDRQMLSQPTMTIEVIIPSGRASLPHPTSTVSFWHTQPSKLLLGHQTTKHLPTKADVVIIGSGITGAFAAHNLSNDVRGKGLDVVMLEAREACWGATGRVS